MARTMKKGDTSPPLRGEAADEGGNLLDLRSALSLEVIAVGPSVTITGDATPIYPAIADEDGTHRWNWEYDFLPGDTDGEGDYAVVLKVTWAAGQIQTFPNEGTERLTIEA